MRGRKTVYALPQDVRLRSEASKPDIACLFYGDLDTDTPEQFILRQEEATLLRRAVDELPVREACVLRCKYGFGCEPMTLDRIGEMLGVTGESVRRIQNGAERRLRRLLKTEFSERCRVFAKPAKRAKVWWEEPTQERPLERAMQEAEAARQAVHPTQFAKPSCNDPVNRYCNFYTPRVTNAATGEWEWVKYDPRTAQV